MLYDLIYSFHEQLSFLNVFRYQTFRAMVAFLLAFFVVLFFQPIFIRWLQNRGIKGQPIRDDGPKAHEIKRGTPTMGGLVVVVAVLLATVFLADLANLKVWLAMFVMAAFGYLGFIDDWKKITKQNSAGLSERQKLFAQFGISALVIAVLVAMGFSTDILIPFTKDLKFSLGSNPEGAAQSWSLINLLWSLPFILFAALVITGTANAVNFTDGLDGLAIGPIMTVAATYAVFTYLTGNIEHAKYLGIHHEAGVGELTILLAALVAGGLGFLWYNAYPAQVFMGDTGSMAFGGVLGFAALLVKQELILIVAGGIFVLEAMSVIIQRYYYKLTKKRVFKMAPIHHHFELVGWAEPKIIVRFWIISIILAMVALTSLKLR